MLCVIRTEENPESTYPEIADGNISNSFRQFHGKGDRSVVSAEIESKEKIEIVDRRGKKI